MRYERGTVYLVPITDRLCVAGVVGRVKKNGIFLGFYFGQAFAEPPSLEDLAGLSPRDAILVRGTAPWALKKGYWPILGRLPSFEASEWSPPLLYFELPHPGGPAYLRRYDDDYERMIEEFEVSRELRGSYFEIGLVHPDWAAREIREAIGMAAPEEGGPPYTNLMELELERRQANPAARSPRGRSPKTGGSR